MPEIEIFSETESKPKRRGVIILITVLAIAVILIYWSLYKMFVQFNPSDVRDYISEAAAAYDGSSQAAAQKIIQDGVTEILKSRAATDQVLTIAKVNGTPPALELVHAALMAAKGYGYLA